MDDSNLDPNEATEEKQPRTNAAQRAAEAAAQLAVKYIWDGDHAYVVVREVDHVRTLAVGSAAFRRWVAGLMRARGEGAPSGETLKRIELDVEATAAAEGVRETPSIRVAGTPDGTIYLDLGDDSWTCVRITKTGWEVVPHPEDGPYMYRPPNMAALPTPQSGGSLAMDLWDFANVTRREDRMLFLVWLVYALWPRAPFPLLALFGEQGSGKTTAASVAKALTDPTRSTRETPAPTSPRMPPREHRDITAAAYQARVLAFDNVSYLNDELADALCRLATGAQLGGRALFTDFDEAIFTAARPVVLNGIPDMVNRSDLADRTLKIECEAPSRQASESKLWKDFGGAWPLLLGGLLDLLVVALLYWGEAGPVVEGSGVTVRMPDFARVGEAIGKYLGWPPGEFTQVYAASRSKAAASVATLDELFDPIESLLLPSGQWSGTCGELLSALNIARPEGARSRTWPQTPHSLAARMRRLKQSLMAAGIQLSVTDGRKSIYTLQRAES